MRACSLAPAILLLLAACGGAQTGPVGDAVPPVVSGGAAKAPRDGEAGGEHRPSSAPASGIFAGTIVESMNSGGYTYVRLKREHDEVWIAAREFKAVVGEPLQVSVEMMMRDFRSPTLNRSFELLYFASQVAGRGQTLAPVPPAKPANQPSPTESFPNREVAPSRAPAGNRVAAMVPCLRCRPPAPPGGDAFPPGRRTA
jgi:hypothetical protein